MKNLGIKLSLFLNYFVFAFLLNSVGSVILQVQRAYDIEKDTASLLEGFKDFPIAIAAFILASFLPKLGLKRAMLSGLLIVSIFCFLTPFLNEFWYFKLLFVAIGISFALIKVSVFATISLITNNEKEHSSFMGILEAVFMGGILLGNILFSFFIDDDNPKSEHWLNMYWYMGGLSLVAFFILITTKFDESKSKIEKRSFKEDFIEMFKIALKPLVLIFIVSIFLYVLIEQSFQTWFPTFYESILNTPASMAIQAGAVLAGATMIGRFIGGIILSKVKWVYVLSICLIMVAIIVMLALPLANSVSIDNEISWLSAPLVVYLMPLMGLFIAPIYPTLNSTILSSLPKHMHSSMAGLIVIFSALGGTTGSMITGNIFKIYSGTTAFYFSLIPIVAIFIIIWILYRAISKN
ncbi:MFS transporter [Winogradskyella sp. PG-2]|uniref:MFS transporter n=1 Tax=Winogradskyella sp. PG-2 TaxID=754409 RepID=UPI0004587874|nr:MFS transporter [Winogradskyella sp. PG-2]BAO76119.1 predicted trehalose permease, MFS family, FucP subfamily [Winogradskyella sp. PG-2]